jgi:hypothetical protein
MNIDNYGLILSGGDGGDSCQRMFTVFLRENILQSINKGVPQFSNMVGPTYAQTLLEPKADGNYIRNPDPTKWYSDPTTTSRDQLTAPLCYHAYEAFHGNGYSKRYLIRLLWACIKRGMFAQNIHRNWGELGWKVPDFMDPSIWSVFLRGSKLLSYVFYPLLMVLDMFMLIGVIIKLWAPITKDGTLQFVARSPDDSDDENLNNVIMVAQYTLATPFSWLARKLYKKFRQQNYGNTVMGETSAIMGAMVWYHRAPAGNPEIAELARPIVERY